jgi:hypothetical protein
MVGIEQLYSFPLMQDKKNYGSKQLSLNSNINCHVRIIFRTVLIPQQSEMFQDDLFPESKSSEASITADEWSGGKNAAPKMMSLEGLFKGKGQAAITAKKTTGLSSLKGKLAAKKASGAGGQEEV